MMTSKSLRAAVGNLMVVGLESTELSAMERAWLRVVRPAGIILFRRNIRDAAQTRELLHAATQACADHAMRCVDVEGGTVDRLRDALAPLPAAQSVARWKDTALAREQGFLTGRAVRAFGMNTTLAPVLDLGLPESSMVMGTRTAAADAKKVVAYARAFLDGLRRLGVTGCGKHFPGLGGGTLDSHQQMPAIERSFQQMMREDIEPFRALRSALPMVMVSHAAYPQTEGGTTPASLSQFWIETVLRGQVGYRGLVFSDDMEMGGVLNARPIEEAAVMALAAGMDVIEVCHRSELILRAFEAVLREAEQSSSFRAIVQRRARRVAAWRSKQFGGGIGAMPNAAELEELRTTMRRFHECVMREPTR
jgi:beta-N-acetylhexosaminidase